MIKKKGSPEKIEVFCAHPAYVTTDSGIRCHICAARTTPTVPFPDTVVSYFYLENYLTDVVVAEDPPRL